MSPPALLRYLMFPLRTAPLILIVLFAFLLTAAEFGGVYGMLTFVVIGSWFFKYGFVLLDHVVDGRNEPPVLSPEMANPVEQRPLGTFLLLIALYQFTGLLRASIGEIATDVLRGIVLVLIPAMIAAMSVTGRFVDALNPVAVFGTIFRIPLAYGLLLTMIGASWLLATWILQTSDYSLTDIWRRESFLPGHLVATVGIKGVVGGMFRLMVLMYLWLAMFACIGGMIYEHRRELDVEPAESPERKAARALGKLERERDKIMDRIMAEVRGGAFGNAGETLRRQIDAAALPLEECQWLYARAQALPNQQLAEYIAGLTLPHLLSAGATGKALTILRDRLSLNSDFRPRTGGQALQLAQLACNAGDRSLARRLLGDFESRYPSDNLQSIVIKIREEIAR